MKKWVHGDSSIERVDRLDPRPQLSDGYAKAVLRWDNSSPECFSGEIRRTKRYLIKSGVNTPGTVACLCCWSDGVVDHVLLHAGHDECPARIIEFFKLVRGFAGDEQALARLLGSGVAGPIGALVMLPFVKHHFAGDWIKSELVGNSPVVSDDNDETMLWNFSRRLEAEEKARRIREPS